MPSPYLSKSDFKTCCDCRTKLFYRKNSYPTNLDENEYLKFLADGGFMIETVAKAQYPTGVDLADERDPSRAFARTKELLNATPTAVVFEAAALWEKFYARIDVLRREGDTLHLIEVKSSSINAEDPEDDAESPFLNAKGAVSSKWREYLLDVAFQARLLRQAFPAFRVKPWLCVVNKGHRATAHETMAHFRVVRDEQNPRARPEVIYEGDLSALRGTALLAFRDVTAEIDLLAPEVETQAESLASLLDGRGGVTRVQEPVAEFYKTCRTCEYRFQDGRPAEGHGFAECWGQLAEASPHILNLHRVGQIGSSTFPDPVPSLLARGRASFLDLTEDELGKAGTRQERRQIQWTHSADGGSEHLPRVLQKTLRDHQTSPGWPLHFLDFEACNVALPYHAGLRHDVFSPREGRRRKREQHIRRIQAVQPDRQTRQRLDFGHTAKDPSLSRAAPHLPMEPPQAAQAFRHKPTHPAPRKVGQRFVFAEFRDPMKILQQVARHVGPEGFVRKEVGDVPVERGEMPQPPCDRRIAQRAPERAQPPRAYVLGRQLPKQLSRRL